MKYAKVKALVVLLLISQKSTLAIDPYIRFVHRSGAINPFAIVLYSCLDRCKENFQAYTEALTKCRGACIENSYKNFWKTHR
jgi:hypothetical protein